MKLTLIAISLLSILSFSEVTQTTTTEIDTTEEVYGSSFSLVNDTKNKISIYTGSGYVSLNKGSKTSISCKVGKTVHWASKGKKGDVIFKITSDMCGETVKLSKVMD
ncbi:hypothetical protein IMCC3317_39350 [Kordia antarctica]|uniref:Uncharacterized protein n=1 Tax=Kordia antarctica TaxID=1218801 RepID=A0A7L4ZPI3_9FLAO|nr:hypothetical protein [Kordia antarctica]QHI38542.1 hypothetical protein IMCC3317_39350 [Kordia antarctica]